MFFKQDVRFNFLRDHKYEVDASLCCISSFCIHAHVSLSCSQLLLRRLFWVSLRNLWQLKQQVTFSDFSVKHLSVDDQHLHLHGIKSTFQVQTHVSHQCLLLLSSVSGLNSASSQILKS